MTRLDQETVQPGKSQALLEILERAIKKYHNKLLTTAEIIQELINLAKEIRKGTMKLNV